MEQFSTPSLMVDAPRRSYDRQGMYPYWDDQDRTSSPLSHDHNYFSAPTSPRAWQNLVQNDNLDLSSVPGSRFEVDGNGGDKRNHDEEEFEFEFISPVSESDEPPLSPTLIFNSSSWMLLRQPPPPLMKPPPHLRRPNSLSVQEVSPTLEKSHVLEKEDKDAATQQQEKPSIKAKNWRLKDFLNQNNGQKKKCPPISHSWPHERQQGSMSSSSSSPSSVATGKKAMNGIAMQMRISSPPSFPLPLPPPPSTPISSLPSSTRKSSTTASPHETLYRSKRAQLRSRQKTTALPYCPGFLGCLRFASKCYIPIVEFSRGLQPVT